MVSKVVARRGEHHGAAVRMCNYERDHPGEMILIDTKDLGMLKRVGRRARGDRDGQSDVRGIGREFVHVYIDDHSRLGFAEVIAKEKKESAIAFFEAAVAWCAGLGITVERAMMDNS